MLSKVQKKTYAKKPSTLTLKPLLLGVLMFISFSPQFYRKVYRSLKHDLTRQTTPMEGYTNMSNIQLDKKSQELLTEGNGQVAECGNTEPEHRGTGDAGEGTKRGLRR